MQQKIGIITITNGCNYGNRLQNYALQRKLSKYNFEVETIINERPKYIIKIRVKSFIKHFLPILKYKFEIKRKKNFKKFNKKILFSNFEISNQNYRIPQLAEYSFFVAGSDQIWNVNFPENSIINFLGFCDSSKKISYAASFGIDVLPTNYDKKIIEWLKDIKYLSVREDAGKEIVKEVTGRRDVDVSIDPTMLLTSEEWDEVSKKPVMLKTDKYILNYFLGSLSETRKHEIEKIARENCCEIINILDKYSPFYECGPSEFLYLEKNAFLICTDSFHSSVFALLYDVPFVVFDREEKGMENMGSRLDTLISKFKLKNRRYNGKYITKENLEHNYTRAYKILDEERRKSSDFLKKALNVSCEDEK